MRRNWWKILSVILLVYTFIYGFLVNVPDIGNLQQTIRNLFFHVPMWFAQLILITVSLVNAVMYLRKPSAELDNKSNEYAKTGIVFGLLGLITGASVMGTMFMFASGSSDIATAQPDAVATGMQITFFVSGLLMVFALAASWAGIIFSNEVRHQ